MPVVFPRRWHSFAIKTLFIGDVGAVTAGSRWFGASPRCGGDEGTLECLVQVIIHKALGFLMCHLKAL